jgi:predicted CopG family antitoxin
VTKAKAEVMIDRKNINVSIETYERLKKFGVFGESFDDLLTRFMDHMDKCERIKK